jgi:N-acetylglucosamine-6-phosphate deacetylase
MKIQGRHYATAEMVELTIEDGTIRSVQTFPVSTSERSECWIAPALFDLQINGCHGLDFSSNKLTVDHIRRIIAVCRQHGIGSFCPTLITNSDAALLHGFRTIATACDQEAGILTAIPALHLEGPYISAEDGPRGAHPRAHIRPPDWDEFRRYQDAANGRIRLVTLAPELEGALGFIEKLVASSVVVAIGHTAANGACIRDAVRAGARLSTHLGNGSHALLPRHNNYIWQQLATDNLWASIICDGHHLPETVVRCIVRVKTPARTILTCDAGSLAGLPAGRYREWGQDLDVLLEGKIVVAESGYLAGSWVFTDQCVGNVIRFAGVSLSEAVDMASVRPRQLLGLPEQRLEAGHPADLVLFDWTPEGGLRVRSTWIRGARSACRDDATELSSRPEAVSRMGM